MTPPPEGSIRERGAAAIEFALILPLLLLVLAGIIDMGRLFYAQVVTSNAAREGARMSAIGYTDGEVRSRIQSWELGQSLFSPSAPQVTIQNLCATSPADVDTTVTIVYRDFDWIILDAMSSFFGAPIEPADPQASATMRCGG